MKKFISRKFLATLLTNIIMIVTMFVNNGNEKVEITALFILGIANICYAIVEGTIDFKAVVHQIAETSKAIDEKMESDNKWKKLL